jgi:hypothetical protein
MVVDNRATSQYQRGLITVSKNANATQHIPLVVRRPMDYEERRDGDWAIRFPARCRVL